jgi:glucose/arabinose dehydrogenase
MRRSVRRALGVAILVAAAAGCGADRPSAGVALRPIGAGVNGPAGLTAATYAVGVAHASALALDEQGRVWVATAAVQDTGSDTVFVVASRGAPPQPVLTGLHTPLGLLWVGGALYVASAGRVDMYTGFDGSTFTTTRTIVTLAAGTGENNGLALLPDGRIAMGTSAPCDHCQPTLPYSASIVTFRPDGSELQVDARNIRAPIGLVALPTAGDLLVTMNQRDDLGQATPGDWLAVVRPGDDWGFPLCYGQSARGCRSTPRPLAVLDKHAAVSGVTLVSGPLSDGSGTAALVAEWNTAKVLRVPLTPDEAGATGAPETLLTGIQRPEPLLTTPSGAVLVGDWATGTIYEIAGGS